MDIRRGDVIMATLPPGVGSKQGGQRPAVVVQNNTGNHFSPTTIIVPGTSARKKPLPTHVCLDANSRCGIKLDTTFMGEQVTVIDKSQIVGRLGRLSDAELARVTVALQVSMELMSQDARRVS